MPLTPSEIVFVVGFIVFFAIRKFHSRHWRKRVKVDVRIDWIEKLLLGLISFGMLLVPLVYLFSPWISFADFFGPAWLIWPGGVLMAVSAILFWHAHADLGRNWSPSLEIGDDQTLVTCGIYRRIRHPMYAAAFLYAFAQMLLLPNWIAGPSTLITFLPLYLIRLPREERMMMDRFGDDYRHYMKTTGRLIPRPSR